jgi:radical SAM protein with 4Fe4S-binding SPASM domain
LAEIETHEGYLVRRISPGESIGALTDFPRYFEIETINACNAACPMCTIADWNRRDGAMKDDLFEKIAGEIERHAGAVKRVHLYRDGEPLLDKKLGRRIERLKRAGVKEVGISTNVELLTPDKAEVLFLSGLDELILSVDSLKPEVYAKIRVGLDFDRVLVNCHSAFRVRDWLGTKKCKIRVRMIRQELNIDEWPAFEAYWKPYLSSHGDTVEYRDIHNWGGQLEGFKAIAAADTMRPCLALWSLMVIFADGSVPLCNVDYNKKYPLGNVKENSIAELWRSHEQNRRRNIHMHGLRAAIPPCTNCTVWSEDAAHQISGEN